MSDSQQTLTSNLPIIEENSLHRIATTVKLYQEFNEICIIVLALWILKCRGDLCVAISNWSGEVEFERIYSKSDPKSLEAFCYKKYYEGKGENERFRLLNSPLAKGVAGESQTGYFLELGDYLKVDLDEQKNVIAIHSVKPFYWKEWNFEEDVEREDWSKGVSYQTIFDNANYIKVTNPNNFIVSYYFAINLANTHLGPVHGISPICFKKAVSFMKANFDSVVMLFGSSFESYVNFTCATFNDFTNLNGSNFNGKVTFNQSTFFKSINLKKCHFNSSFSSLNSYFNQTIDFDGSIFKSTIDFSMSIFVGNANFKRAIFFEEVKLSHITLNPTPKKNTTGDTEIASTRGKWRDRLASTADQKGDGKSGELKFASTEETNTYLDFKGVTAEKNFKISINKLGEKQNVSVDFEGSNFDKKLYFRLENDNQYNQVTLNLKDISYGDFVCDDRNLSEVNLFYSDKNGNVRDKNDEKVVASAKNKNLIETAIAERRVFRKILQELNWGDKADLEYAKIMTLQGKLEGTWIKNFFFGWWLGWGVRIVEKNPLKGGIIWSSLALLAIYGVVYLIGSVFSKISTNEEIFGVLNLVFTADIKNGADLFVVMTSFVQLNLFLVILARKFMRM